MTPQEFIEASKEETATLHHSAAYRWNKFVYERVCSHCGRPARHYHYTCELCKAPTCERERPGREGWLVAPHDFSNAFISAPYAWGESVGAVNRKVLEFEAEPYDDHWAYFFRPGHTTGGGLIAFDPECLELVELLAEFEDRLSQYPLLDDDAHAEVEREMWETAIDDWMVGQFIRAVSRHDAVAEFSGGYTNEAVEEWLEESSYATAVVRAILWGFQGRYSADDPSYDSRAVDSFARGLAEFFESVDLVGALDVGMSIPELVWAYEFQFLVDHERGYVSPSKNLEVEYRDEVRP